MEVEKRECEVCRTLQPETLFASSESNDCVYCVAKQQEALPVAKEKEEEESQREKEGEEVLSVIR